MYIGRTLVSARGAGLVPLAANFKNIGQSTNHRPANRLRCEQTVTSIAVLEAAEQTSDYS